MAIRLDVEEAAQPSLFNAQEPDNGTDPLLIDTADPQGESYGVNLLHDGNDRNKGAGIRI